jgi:glucose/arabinose dehydrogenase
MAVCLWAGAAPTSAQSFVEPGFTTEVVTTLAPYSLVGLAWAPDGRLFVGQKNGVVRVIKNGVLLPTPFIDLSDSKVNTFDDRGLWGLEFHRNFAANGYVFLSYVFEDAGNPNSRAARTSRLTRVTADPLNPDVALPGSAVIILGSVGTPPCSAHPATADCIPADAGTHTIGTIRFAPDGTVFVGNGDGSYGDDRGGGPGARQLPGKDPADQSRWNRRERQSLLRRDEFDSVEDVAVWRAQPVPLLPPQLWRHLFRRCRLEHL